MSLVSKGALREEESGAVPHSLKKDEEFCHGGNGQRGLGAEGTELRRADMDLELAISLGAMEPIQGFDVILVPKHQASYEGGFPPAFRGWCYEFDLTELIDAVGSDIESAKCFDVPALQDGKDVGIEEAEPVRFFLI